MPDIHLMLAKHISDIDNIDELLQQNTYYYEPKIDGFRAVINSNNKIYSRYGNEFNINLNLNIPKGYYIDGELYGKNFFETYKIKRKEITDYSDIVFYAFDIVRADIIEKGGVYEKTYIERKKQLKEFCDANINNKYLKCIFGVKFNTDIQKLLHTKFKNEEGFMLKKIDSYYITKRTSDWIKVKHFIDIDAQVIGYELSDKFNQKAIKSLKCKYKDKVFYIGSGFTNAQRVILAQYINELIGSYVNVIAFTETETSLRHPVFNGFLPKKLNKKIIDILCNYKLMRQDACIH